MNNFGLKVEHVCPLQTNHAQPIKLHGKGNTAGHFECILFIQVSQHIGGGGAHIFICSPPVLNYLHCSQPQKAGIVESQSEPWNRVL